MWAKGLLKNWLAFKFRKCFSPAEWNHSESKRTPLAYWNEMCLKDSTPSFNVMPTSISKSQDDFTDTSEVSAAFEKAFERRPEKGSWFTDCCCALLTSETFTIVGDNARASHYSTQCLFPYINSMLLFFLPSTIMPQSSSFLCLCLIVVFLLSSSDNSALCIMCQLHSIPKVTQCFVIQ